MPDPNSPPCHKCGKPSSHLLVNEDSLDPSPRYACPEHIEGAKVDTFPEVSPLQAAFERYHFANPQVYKLLIGFAVRFRERRPGRKIGIQVLIERVRWEVEVETTDAAPGFKISNSYAAFYARKLMADFPKLAGMFKLHASVADNMTF